MARAEGQAMPSREELARRVPVEATHLIDSTHRILRLYALSGARNPKALRRWKEGQSDPEIKGAGFATSTAQQIAKELFPEEQEAEPVSRDSDPEVEAATPQEGGGVGDEDSEPRGVARVDATALNLFQQWQKQIKDERAEAASEARTQEREIAKAAIEAEKRAAQANIEAEKRESQTQVKLQRAHMRLYATIAVIVALGGGVAIGVAWSGSSANREIVVQQGAATLLQPAPQPHSADKPTQVEVKPKPIDVVKSETASSGTAEKTNDSQAKAMEEARVPKPADADKPTP